MSTTQSVISRLEEGGGARNRLDTLARVATALDRHLILSFPEKLPARLKDAVQVAWVGRHEDSQDRSGVDSRVSVMARHLGCRPAPSARR